jgi:hypothetical protein
VLVRLGGAAHADQVVADAGAMLKEESARGRLRHLAEPKDGQGADPEG